MVYSAQCKPHVRKTGYAAVSRCGVFRGVRLLLVRTCGSSGQRRNVNMAAGMSQVLDTLYVGSEEDSLDGNQMKEKKIMAVVRIDDDPKSTEQIELNPPPRYHLLELWDTKHTEVSNKSISDMNDFIHEARLKGENVLVHCQLGISRSATMVTAYLMSISKLGVNDALRALQVARPIANPNEGLRKQLTRFEAIDVETERERMRMKFGPKGFDRLMKTDMAALEGLLKKAPAHAK